MMSSGFTEEQIRQVSDEAWLMGAIWATLNPPSPLQRLWRWLRAAHHKAG